MLFRSSKFLYDMDENVKGVTECRIIAAGSYPGHALTFDILIPETGAVFDYTPIHLLTTKPDALTLGMKTLLVRDCPDSAIDVSVLGYLKDKKLSVQLHLDGKADSWVWKSGKYLFSVDWYNRNELFNVIALEGGQICAQPHYRMLVGDVELKLPTYKKLHSEWKVNP